jgi:hypothetical protein
MSAWTKIGWPLESCGVRSGIRSFTEGTGNGLFHEEYNLVRKGMGWIDELACMACFLPSLNVSSLTIK